MKHTDVTILLLIVLFAPTPSVSQYGCCCCCCYPGGGLGGGLLGGLGGLLGGLGGPLMPFNPMGGLLGKLN
ncbi:unnamed protein product [Heligmosomoides polygyrus]|uniref:Secreted protein n=1 Tax=Heligmosomoides polygyrus TaxID=6339 RepID=A0A183GIH3_HELPZ|nr:unnamed protein product [Heligmosomoides polygyrus]